MYTALFQSQSQPNRTAGNPIQGKTKTRIYTMTINIVFNIVLGGASQFN